MYGILAFMLLLLRLQTTGVLRPSEERPPVPGEWGTSDTFLAGLRAALEKVVKPCFSSLILASLLYEAVDCGSSWPAIQTWSISNCPCRYSSCTKETGSWSNRLSVVWGSAMEHFVWFFKEFVATDIRTSRIKEMVGHFFFLGFVFHHRDNGITMFLLSSTILSWHFLGFIKNLSHRKLKVFRSTFLFLQGGKENN